VRSIASKGELVYSNPDCPSELNFGTFKISTYEGIIRVITRGSQSSFCLIVDQNAPGHEKFLREFSRNEKSEPGLEFTVGILPSFGERDPRGYDNPRLTKDLLQKLEGKSVIIEGIIAETSMVPGFLLTIKSIWLKC